MITLTRLQETKNADSWTVICFSILMEPGPGFADIQQKQTVAIKDLCCPDILL
jgi:hypothetical protein